MTSANDSSLLSVLQKRSRVLALLVGATRTKPELVDELGVSRSTVDRAVRELDERGLVSRSDGGFSATLTGRLANDAYTEFCDQIRVLAETSDLLTHLSADAELNLCVLTGAEVVEAEQPAPYKPASRLEEYIRRATSVRALTRAIVSSPIPEALHEGVTERGVAFESVYTEPVAEFLRTNRRDERHEMVETGHYRVYETDALPFGLMLFEEPDRCVVCINVYDDTNDLRGVIVNDTPEAVAWAEDLFETYRAAATDVTDAFE
jgi:predicted transcriptional regulator